MRKSLSPRHAAEQLGITPDTLRRWERDGLIHSERTPGGQRRYRDDAIDALLEHHKDRTPATQTLAPHSRTEHLDALDADDDANVDASGPPDTARRRVVDVPPWERRVKEERADLEVTRLRRERAALIRAERESRATRQREVEEQRQRAHDQQRKEEASIADVRRLAAADAAERRRLDGLRTFGRSLALFAPTDCQAKVVRDLLRTVNSDDYPPELGDYFAREQVTARVHDLLKPWRDSQARERAKGNDNRKCDSLTTSGKWYANAETRDWDRREAERARREVERALREGVEADWTQDDVRDLVDDVLDQWDDD